MKGKIIKDWTKVDLNSPESWKKITGAINHFFRLPEDAKFKAAMQMFAMKGDFPDNVLQILEKYHAIPDYDLGYEQIFDIRDFTGTNESGFKILDVESGLTFAKVKSGDKAKVFKFEGAVTSVTFDRYGGALGWDRELMDDRQYWTLEDNAIAFRNKAYSSRAESFYDLIEALGAGYNLAWQNPTPAGLANTDAQYTASRDANTINKACEEILLALKDKGMGVTANSEFIVLVPIQLKGRIQAALTKLNQPVVGATKQTYYNVKPVYTLMLDTTNVYYVIMPKKKLKGGYRMDLTLYSQFDILAYSDTVAGWMRYGGAIGESDQLRRCATA